MKNKDIAKVAVSMGRIVLLVKGVCLAAVVYRTVRNVSTDCGEVMEGKLSGLRRMGVHYGAT